MSRNNAGPGLGSNFRLLWFAAIAASLGAGMSELAFPWVASSETRNPVLIAALNAAFELPWLLFSLQFGALIDRHDTRRILISANLIRSVLLILVALAVVLDVGTIYLLILLAFLLGTLQVGAENSEQTFLPRIVASGALERANSRLVATTAITGGFLGPWVAGTLLDWSLYATFIAEAALLCLATIFITSVRVPREHREPSETPLREEIREGVRLFWARADLRSLGILLGVLNLSSGIAVATQVLFVREILGMSAYQYAALFSVGALGGVLGAVMAPTFERRFGPRRVLLATLLTTALSTLLIGLTSSMIVVGVAVALAASGSLIWNIITVSYRQRVVPADQLGRINSIYRLLSWGPLPLGSVVGGLLVSAGASMFGREAGLRIPLFFASALALCGLAVALLRLRAGLWHPDYRRPEDTSESERSLP